MKPQHSFVAERIAAQHCAELLRRGPEPVDLLPAMARLGERLARALAPAVATLLGGDAPAVTVSAPAELSEADLIDEAGPLAANSLLATAIPGVALLASVDGQAALRLVDRAFGGRGEAAGPLPEAFPLSAELMIAQLETLIAGCLGEALGQPELKSLKRDSRLAELAPFPAGARLTVLRIEVMEGSAKPWKLLIALPSVQLPRLLGRDAAATRPVRAANPAVAPFADVPLPLTATLVDMAMPLSLLATLAPGTVLPVAVARAVPLSVGGAALARGSVGTQDDQIAIKLSQIA